MAKNFDWDETIKRGELGEQLLIQHLRAQGHAVEDVSADWVWRKRDIDLLVDGQMVEVKTDSHDPKNLFLELTISGKPGCVFISRAQAWVVVYPKAAVAYWVELPYLQWWLLSHQGDYRPIVVKSHRSYADRTVNWQVVGIAVPVADLIRDGVPVRTLALGAPQHDGYRHHSRGQDRPGVAS